MTGMSSALPFQRLPPRARAALAWTGFVLFPVLIAFSYTLGTILPLGLRYVALPLVTVLLLAGALARRPLAVLVLLLVTGVLAEVFLSPGMPPALVYQEVARVIHTVAIATAVGYVAFFRPWRVSVPAAAGALAVQVAVEFAARIGTPPVVASWVIQDVLAIGCAWVVGVTLSQRRQQARAHRAAAESRAVQEERLRIARELHDMVAHSIGVIAFQAGMGRRVIDAQPAQAREALAAIEDTSRETLTALRRMLGTLRRADPDVGKVPLGPAPGLADLDALVERSRNAGVRVVVRRIGEPAVLPPDIDLSAYRLIQEAVTNVVRHADVGRCDVAIVHSPGELGIEVVDAGRGSAPGVGYGIVGMRERVTLLDGDFEAGPRPAGGFRVAARIPLPEGSR